MEAALLAWLEQMGSTILWWSLGLLVLVDLTALAVVAATRDRALVNRWTGRVLAANLVLLGTGVGGVAASMTGRLVVSMVASVLPSASTASLSHGDEAPPGER